MLKRFLLALLFAALPVGALAQAISALPAASALDGTEAAPFLQGGTAKKATALQIRTYANASLATVATSGSASDLGSGTLPAARLPAHTGDATSSTGSAALTLATVNSNVGSFGSATSCVAITVNAKGLVTAASASTCAPAIGSITGLGTGIATALAVNTGSAGAPVLFNGALGTPSSGTLTSATGLPISTGVSGLGTGVATALGTAVGSAGGPVVFNGAGGTPSSITLTNASGTAASLTAGTASAVAVGGITGLGTGVGTFLATPSGANLASALTTALPVSKGGTNATSASITAFNNITGLSAAGTTGTTSTNLVFSTSPVLTTPNLGTPSALTLTNATGLPLATGISGLTKGTSNPGSPATGDLVWRSDLALVCYYDGTRWLSTHEYATAFQLYTSTLPYSVNKPSTNINAAVDHSAGGMWITRWQMHAYVDTTNTGSAFWTAQLVSFNGTSDTNIGSSVSTAADAANTHLNKSVTVGAAVASVASQVMLSITLTKTGSPGSIYPEISVLWYRLICS